MPAIWHKQDHVAVVQLEQAIRLFLEEKDFYSAATLAATSEEISGKIAKQHGKFAARDDALKELMLRFSKQQILSLLENKKEKSEEIALEWVLLNYSTWLRHYDKDNDCFYINIEVAAYELIGRAIKNLENCGYEIKNAEKFRKDAPRIFSAGV